jgi:hypothetical protein
MPQATTREKKEKAQPKEGRVIPLAVYRSLRQTSRLERKGASRANDERISLLQQECLWNLAKAQEEVQPTENSRLLRRVRD